MLHLRFASLALVCSLAAYAQDVISAKSGLIHWTEGVVTLDGKRVVRKAADFPNVKPGQELRAEEGKAEVLLTPGVFLRVSENSGFRLVKDDLLDTQLELTGGSLLLEVGDLEKTQSLSMTIGSSKIEFPKKGLYRLDSEPARLRVYDGSAIAVVNDQSVTVKEGRQVVLQGVLVSDKFDKEVGDEFQRWAGRRSGYIAAANLVAAKRYSDSGYGLSSNRWIFNPYMGLFTYLPLSGIYRSPFGYSFYSPLTIGSVYYRPSYSGYGNNGGLGGYGGGMNAGWGSSPSVQGMGGSVGGRNMGSFSPSSGGMGGGGGAVAVAAPAGGGRGVSAGGGGGGGGRGGAGGR